MNYTKRQSLIIDCLKDHHIITAKELANQLSVSSKTVRNDIKKINEKKTGTIIHSVPGQGYRIDKNFTQQDSDWHYNENSIYFEILNLLINKLKVDFYEVADQLFISESTLGRRIKEINKKLSKYEKNLKIIRSDNQLYIQGEEDKRKIFKYFLDREVETITLNLQMYESYFKYCNIEELSKILHDYNIKNDFIINDFKTITMVLHLAILIERISDEHYVTGYQDVNDSYSMYLAEGLVKKIQKTYEILFTQSEIHYIAKLYSVNIPQKNKKESKKSLDIINRILSEINDEFSIDFSENESFVKHLDNHLESLYERSQHAKYLPNPFTDEIKNKSPLIYNLSVYAASVIKKEWGCELPEDEITYIALHFLSASRYEKKGKVKNVTILSPFGMGAMFLIKNQLNTIPNYSFEVTEFLSIFDKNKVKNTSADLILTTISITEHDDLPIYHFDGLLTQEDLDNIADLLIVSENKSIFNHFFKPELFYVDKEFNHKTQVIEFLCEKLNEYDYVEADYVNKVLEREKLSSTSYKKCYAIPHAIYREAKENIVAVCNLKNPVKWAGDDVNIVFLFALKKEKDNAFEQIFNIFSRILDNKEDVIKLSKAKCYDDFITISDSILKNN